MSLDTLLLLIFGIAILIAACAGAYAFFRSPTAYVAIGTAIFVKLRPLIFAYILKRMPPEKEEEWRQCMRRGGVWDFHRKKCKL